MMTILSRTAAFALVGILSAVTTLAPTAVADPVDLLDCTGDVGDPVPGTIGWDLADHNQRLCANEGNRTHLSNPAFLMAKAQQQVQAPEFSGDPFREPAARWAEQRGQYAEVTFTDSDGSVRDAALLGPLDTSAAPYPGVVIVCHTCISSVQNNANYAFAQTLAEAGYIVMIANVGGNNVPVTVDAVDYLVATPDAPSPQGEYNPWFDLLDRDLLGITGHSGAGGVSLSLGHTDPRVGAIVAWDPAGSITGLELTTPTMIQTADYHTTRPLSLGATVFEPRRTKPEPQPGSKYRYFEELRSAGVDAMHVTPRASTHFEWSRPVGPYSTYGEMIAVYYTLAWFDRYLRGAREEAVAADALRRLTETDAFDRSADVHSIGAGHFDAYKANQGGSLEGGNVPITIGGLQVRNMLSFWYESRYFLEGGSLVCESLRAGCAP